jgi:hypothetical protein
MIYIDGKYEYIHFKNKIGEFHRLDGPAYFKHNIQIWYKNGKRHRLDGPAYIDGDKQRYWYIRGFLFPESEYHDKLKEMGMV